MKSTRGPGQAPRTTLRRQRGIALLAILTILAVSAIYLFVTQLNAAQWESKRIGVTDEALARAAEAVIAQAASKSNLDRAGLLVVPDTGWTAGNPEGRSEGNIEGTADISVIGKIPWTTLGIDALRDGYGECLWYVVSGRAKDVSIAPAPYNWDTAGQIDVVDGAGNVILTNVAALVAAPGFVLDGQDRALADPALVQCGGNYDARNYLDAYNGADAIGGEVNYFAGSTNNHVAPDAANKRFVLAANGHYNDRFRPITVDEIFRAVMRRSDFRDQVGQLMDSLVVQVKGIDVEGDKGADDIDCSTLSPSSVRTFCDNWKEMVLLVELSVPASIRIDGASTPNCTRVLMFGGQRTSTQSRASLSDKDKPENYLEGANLTAFNAKSGVFDGKSTFDYRNPATDLLRCVEP